MLCVVQITLIILFLQTVEIENTSQPSTYDVMKIYRSQIETGIEYIEFNRMQMSTIRQLMRIYKSKDLNLRKLPDVSFTGECGADMGGPRKEFFHISLASLTKVDVVYNFQLFSGEEGHLVTMYGVDVMSSGCFMMAGKIIAHSILHDCGGMDGLSPAIVKYITTGSIEEAGKIVTSHDIPDTELQLLLDEKVGNCLLLLEQFKMSPLLFSCCHLYKLYTCRKLMPDDFTQ